jgi:hypothetical protein
MKKDSYLKDYFMASIWVWPMVSFPMFMNTFELTTLWLVIIGFITYTLSFWFFIMHLVDGIKKNIK